MPKHTSKDTTNHSSAVADHPDNPDRVTGNQKTSAPDHDLTDFLRALAEAVRAGIPHGVLRRCVETHEWDNAPAVR